MAMTNCDPSIMDELLKVDAVLALALLGFLYFLGNWAWQKFRMITHDEKSAIRHNPLLLIWQAEFATLIACMIGTIYFAFRCGLSLPDSSGLMRFCDILGFAVVVAVPTIYTVMLVAAVIWWLIRHRKLVSRCSSFGLLDDDEPMEQLYNDVRWALVREGTRLTRVRRLMSWQAVLWLYLGCLFGALLWAPWLMMRGEYHLLVPLLLFIIFATFASGAYVGYEGDHWLLVLGYYKRLARNKRPGDIDSTGTEDSDLAS